MATQLDSEAPFCFTFMGQRLRFVWERDAGKLERAFHFVDAVHARQFLDALTSDERYGSMLRLLRDQTPQPHTSGHPHSKQLLDELSRQLGRRRLWVVHGPTVARPGTTPNPMPAPTLPPVEPPPVTRPDLQDTYFEVQFVDEIGVPIAGTVIQFDVGGRAPEGNRRRWPGPARWCHGRVWPRESNAANGPA